MKKLPLGIQTFRKIIEGDYVYVDKTQYVYELINGASYYFLSRPRRFGKSLLLDTIGEVFGGDRELFKGLWIYDSDYDFAKHPVIRLDMSGIANETPEILKGSLINALRIRAGEDGLDVGDTVPSDMFSNLIRALYEKYNQKVVVLIDEYDKPILDHLLDVEMAEANRMVIKSFYGILKSMDPFLRLTFITGVSKFTKTSIFSEMNNLLDITLMEEYANVCGVPVGDLDKHFHEHIENLKSNQYLQVYENLHDEILAWYDGYSWDGKTKVINPFGLITFFLQKRFSSFWYASGSPKFLIDMIKKEPDIYTSLHDLQMDEWTMDSFDVRDIQPAALLFQTGYLTIREFVPGDGTTSASYILTIPNHEVRMAFNLHILSAFTGQGGDRMQPAYRKLREALNTGDLQLMRDVLKSLFAAIPYQLHVGAEAYYHSIFYAIMNLLGFNVYAEVSTARGRIDAVLELAGKVYIMEFKYAHCTPDAAPEEKQKLFDQALEEGLKQIEGKGYADGYAGSGKEIIKAAFAFLGRDDIEMRIVS